MRASVGYAWWVAVSVVVLQGGCAPRDSEGTLIVFAAASLGDVVAELAADYQRGSGFRIQVSAGASGALCTQIELGAPCGLFLSADPALLMRLLEAKRITKEGSRTLARNRLVLAVANLVSEKVDRLTSPLTKGGSRGVLQDRKNIPRSLLDKVGSRKSNILSENGNGSGAFGMAWPAGLTLPVVQRIAIADPDTAPAGRYAREALVSLKLWDELQPKLVRAGDVRAAAHYLSLRTVQAAIVYRTDAEALDGVTPVHVFDEMTHTPIEYVGAVVVPLDAVAARGFLEFLGSAAAAPVWRKHGFVPALAEAGR